VDDTVTINDVLAAAADVFTADGVTVWIDAPNALLGRRTPRDVVADGDGQSVLDVLEALAEGVVL
jgi:uncharacterized protein (DUF2384 family)